MVQLMKIISPFWIVGLALLVGSLPASAACPFDPFFKSQPPIPSKAERIKYAKHLLQAAVQLNRAIPELSPSESTWLDKELAQTGSRQWQAFNSVENQKRMGKEVAEANELILRRLPEGQRTKLNDEVLLWASLATNISSNNYLRAFAMLAEMKVLEERHVHGLASDLSSPKLDTKTQLDFSCHTHAQHIMGLIVIPYLRGTLPN